MDKQYEVYCPICGTKLIITISESNSEYIGVTFCDIDSSSENSYFAKELGYEFGEKGGEMNE